MLQTVRSSTGNDFRSDSSNDSGSDYWVKLTTLTQSQREDIDRFINAVGIPDPFEYDCSYKYLYYKQGKLVGIMAYNLVPMVDRLIPLCVHIIGEKTFRHTVTAYKFMLDTFKDLKKSYNIVVVHIPNDRDYIIKGMVRFGFTEYSEDAYGKYYYMYL